MENTNSMEDILNLIDLIPSQSQSLFQDNKKSDFDTYLNVLHDIDDVVMNIPDFSQCMDTEVDTQKTDVVRDTQYKEQIICKVCDDKASGYHYGISTCEGCKGFFRRSNEKLNQFNCLNEGKCMITKKSRNRCQYCRLKKCLAVGMSKDSVRYGRIPNRNKLNCENVKMDEIDSNSKLIIYELIMSVTQAFCNFFEVKKKSEQLDIDNCSCQMSNSPSESLDLVHKNHAFEKLNNAMSDTISRTTEFAKKIPGFLNFSVNDQKTLIKHGFYEVWIATLCNSFDSNNNELMLHNGRTIHKHDLELIYNTDYINRLNEFVKQIKNLNMSQMDLALFSAVIICQPDRTNIENNQKISELQDTLVDALKLQFDRNHSSEPQLLTLILMKLPELRVLNLKHKHLLDYYRERKHQIYINHEFSEIFDL